MHFTKKAYLVKLSTKGLGGVKKVQKRSTWFVHGPLGRLDPGKGGL